MKNILYILLFLPLSVFGQDNYSLDFNRDDAVFSNENDNIILGDISDNSEFIALSDGYTFECWIRLRGHGWTGNSTAHAYIISGIANGLLINDSNLLHWAFYGSDGTIHRLETPYEFPLNEWRHIAISYENNIAYLFDNGELVESKYIPSGLELNWSADGGFSIGIAHWANGWWHPIDGEIDNIRISNNARYTNSFCPTDDYSTDENTVLMWDFNEISDSIVNDISDNEFNGFLYSVNYSEDVPEQNCLVDEPFEDSISSCVQVIDLHLSHSAEGGYLNEGISLISPDGVVEEYCDGACSTGNWSPVNHQPYVQCQNMASSIQEFSSYFEAECVSEDTLRIRVLDLNVDTAYLEVSYCGENCGIWSVNGDVNPQEPIAFSCIEIPEGVINDGIANAHAINVPTDYLTIQDAIDACTDGDTILVAVGTYYVNNLVINKDISIIGENRESTIIDGSGSNRIMTIGSTGLDTLKISNFTIQNGHALNNLGGVIVFPNGNDYSLSVFDNLIIQNSGGGTGNVLFEGAGVNKTIYQNCIVRNNSAENYAGIGGATVIRTMLYGNDGWNNTSALVGCNTYNCIVYNNGGGYGAVTGGNTKNSIIWNNQSSAFNNPESVTFSNIEGVYAGEGNIYLSPLFVNPDDGDFSLQENSPCIDAGDPNSALDLDGTISDMGVFYFDQANVSGCTDNLAINYDDLAWENDSSCTYNTYPIEDENFKAYLQSNYPQTIVNDSLNINATLGIEDLNVDSLEISSLDGLQYFYDLINLNCVANNLSTLPELPSQIEYINCQWNQIDTLPNFPESLKNFDGRHNLITVVPALPNTMEVLRVCFNEVTTIPELPDSLKILFCAYNYEQLTYLPDFPDHLEEVLCFDNEIEQISDIPESMYKFMMQNNSITQIPNIPEGVNILNLTNNPIECVNDYPEQFEEQLGIYPPCSFLDEYTALMDSLDQLSNTNDQLASDLSVFETVEEEQDYSMSFDGDNDWVEAQSISIYDTIIHSLTISSWIKLDEEYNDYGTIVARRNFVGNPTGERHHFELTINPDRSILFSTANNQNNDLYTAQLESEEDLINTSEWCYVSVTFQNGEVSFYLNGDLILNNDFGYREMYPNNHWINIGRIRRSGGQQFFNEFNGNIRGVEIWDINLSQEDIQSYMYCPPTGEEHGLVGYWNFNEGSGVTVYDISGNGNNGVINGGAEFSEDVPESYNGCTDETALNYDESANCDNGSCVYGDEIVSNLEENLSNVIDSLGITLSNLDDCNTEAINALSSLQLALYNWNTIIDLQEGWNMFGYGCPSSIDVTEGLSNHTESIAIVKDNNGSVYMPEFDFNGIGDFTPGFGYQIKLSDAIEGFSLCDWYVNDIPEDNIVSLQEENFSLQAELDSIY